MYRFEEHWVVSLGQENMYNLADCRLCGEESKNQTKGT